MPWFTGSDYGIADIALYRLHLRGPARRHRAGCVPGSRATGWPACEATPGFVPMPAPDAAALALIDQST